MMNSKYLHVIFGSVLGLTIFCAARVFKVPPLHAVALDRYASDSVFALEQDGTVSEVEANQQSLRKILGRLGVGISPADLTSMIDGRTSTILVTSNDIHGKGRLYEFFADGRPSRYWSLQSFCGGLDVDSTARVVYFTDKINGRLMSFDLNNPSASEKSVVLLPKFSAPDPVVVDKANARVFIGDRGNGNIYLVMPATRAATIIARIKGAAISALVFDISQNILYAADANSGTIYSLSTQNIKTAAKTFAVNRRLRRLSGLSLRNNGDLLVSDVRATTIFIVSREGRFIGQFSGGDVTLE